MAIGEYASYFSAQTIGSPGDQHLSLLVYDSTTSAEALEENYSQLETDIPEDQEF